MVIKTFSTETPLNSAAIAPLKPYVRSRHHMSPLSPFLTSSLLHTSPLLILLLVISPKRIRLYFGLTNIFPNRFFLAVDKTL